MGILHRLIHKVAFWRWPNRIRQLEEQLADMQRELFETQAAKDLAQSSEQNLKVKHRTGMYKVMQWIHTTHRLDKPASGIRELIQKSGFAILSLLLLQSVAAAQPAPFQRNAWTTNPPAVSPGIAVQGLNNLLVTNLGSGTSWWFYAVRPQTIARLIDVTNIVGAISAGTNALVQTNGVNIGSIGTLNFNAGVTGFVSGTVVTVGTTGTGGGDAGGTNARQFGTLILTNLGANPIPYTNIIVADVGIQLGTNSGITYITNISGPFLTNWANAISNLVNTKQFGSANLTNWSNIPTGAMANVVSTTFLTNWANAISNYATATTNSASVTGWITLRQPANAVLSNLVGTVARNVTNVVSLSTTNATSKPLTNSYTTGVLTIFGVEQGSGHLLTMNASNIVSANDWAQTASTTNVVGVSNWVNAVSNYVTAATNSASVTNWINLRQPANAVISNLVGTVANNVTNIISLSTSNATSAPLTNAYANGVLTLFGLEGSANISLSHNGSNIVISTAGTAGEVNVNGEVSITNATRMGWVYDKQGVTNRLRSIMGGSGILLTNEGTNIMVAFDPATTNVAMITNWINFRQPANAVLSNLVGTVANNVTNVVSLSTTNATSKPLTNSYANGVLTLFGLEQGANITLTPNGSNIVIATSGVVGEANVNGEVSLTNASMFGWVFDKVGITNRLRSVAARNGLVATNESTNISFAIDPAIVASQANLTTASNQVLALQVWTNNTAGWTHSYRLINPSNFIIGPNGEIMNGMFTTQFWSVVKGKNIATNHQALVSFVDYNRETDIDPLQIYVASSNGVYESGFFYNNAGTTGRISVGTDTNGNNLGETILRSGDSSLVAIQHSHHDGTINGAIDFTLDGLGNLSTIRGVGSYLWPAAHGNGALTNDGAGNLGWWPPTGGSGEVNVNGEVSVTNATRMGWVYDKQGVTNRLRSIMGGSGILLTNEGTNIMVAFDPSITNVAQITNWINFRQPANEVLSNLVGTVARNVTNVVSLSTTNATSKPLTNSYANGVLTLFGLEEGANITLTPNGSNIVIATSGAVGEANVNGEVSVTNATRFGVVYDKVGVTNRLKSFEFMNGVYATNQGTNLTVAFDKTATQPAISDFRMNDFKVAAELGFGFTNRNANKWARSVTGFSLNYADWAIYVSNYVFVGTRFSSPGGAYDTPSRIVRLNADNLSSVLVNTNTHDSEHAQVQDLLYVPSKHRVYETFLASNRTTVTEVNLDTLAVTDVISDNTENVGPRSITTDGTFLYCLTSNNIVKYLLSDFSRVSSMTMTNLTNGTAIRFDGTSLYCIGSGEFGGSTNYWMAKVNTNLTQINQSTNFGRAGQVVKPPVFSGDYAYIPLVGGPAQSGDYGFLTQVSKTNILESSRIPIETKQASGTVHYPQSLTYDGRYIWGPVEGQPGWIVRYDPQNREGLSYLQSDSPIAEDDGSWIVSDGQRIFWLNNAIPFIIERITQLQFDSSVRWYASDGVSGLNYTNGSIALSSNLYVGGNQLGLNGVVYTPPSVQGADKTVLTNNGSGVLGWSTVTGGSGEVNVNGEISLTNATVMGWVYDKSGVTNRLRSIRGGNGILLTNESTNIVAAIDPLVVASQANLTTVSNYTTSATNSPSVTNWINFRQPADAVLSNLVGTLARNVTNVISLSTTNATSKPLTNSYTAGVLTLFGLEEGSNISLTPNGSNIVVSTSGGVGEANVNGEVSLTNNANGIYGLVYDKVGITNRIKSIGSGFGIIITNEGTNLTIAATASGGGQPASTTLTNLTLADRTNWNILGQALFANTNGLAVDYEKKVLTSGVDRANCVLLHSNMLFVGLQDGTSPKFLKFPTPSDLSTYQETNLFADGFHVNATRLFYSQSRAKLILCFYSSSSLTVTEIDPVTLSTNDVIINNTDVNDMMGFTSDDTNLWVCGYSQTLGVNGFEITQFKMSDWSQVGQLNIISGNAVNTNLSQQFNPIKYDIDTGRIYSLAGSNGSMWGFSAPASNMSNYTARTTVSLPISSIGDQLEFIGNYVYGLTGGQNQENTTGVNHIWRMNKSTLEIDRMELGNLETNSLTGMYYDGRYLWLTCSTNTTTAKGRAGLARFNPITMEIDHALLAPTNHAYKLTGDGTNRLFVVAKSLPGEVYRYQAPIINSPAVSWVREQLTNGPGISFSNVNDRWLQISATSTGSGIGSVWSNGVAVVTSTATNLNFITGSNMTFQITNNNGRVDVMVNANSQVSGGSLTTNANQFGSQTTLTIKEGANLTNTLFWPSNLTGPAIIATASAGQVTNLVEWRATNATVGLSISSNGFAMINTPLYHSNAIAFRTNNIDFRLNQYQAFTNALKTNLVLQLTNTYEGVVTRLDAYGSGRLGNATTNAWNLLCTVAAGTTIYWPPGTTNGNFDVLVNSNQVVTLTFMGGLGSTNILASYLVREAIGAN